MIHGEAIEDANIAVYVNDNGTPVSMSKASRKGNEFFASVDAGNSTSANSLTLHIAASYFDPNATPGVGGDQSGNAAGADIIREIIGTLIVPKQNETPGYDDGGRLVSNSIYTYTWDAESRLASVESTIKLDGTNRYKTEYAYDHAGRRIRKQVYTNNDSGWVLSRTHKFFYDTVTLGGSNSDFGLLAEEEITDHAASSTNTYQYLWGVDLNGSYHGLGGVGGLVAVIDKTADKIYIPLMDAKGSVYKYIDADNGIAVAEFDYDPYGRIMQRSGSQVANLSLRYQTKYHDTETNTYYYGVRHYDPTTCRWLSRDPLEEEGGYNLYAFVSNNPINNMDYLGFRITPESNFYKWAKIQTKAGRYLDKDISAMREIYNKEMNSVGILDYIMPFHSQMLRRQPMSGDIMTTLVLGKKLRTSAIVVASVPHAVGIIAPLAVEIGPTTAYVAATNFVSTTPWAMKTATGMGYLMQALTVGTFVFGDDDTRGQMMSVPGGPQAIIYSGGNLLYQGTRGASAALSAIPKINPANYRLNVKPAFGCNFGNVEVNYIGPRVTPPNKEVVVIGERMKRVSVAAKDLAKQGYDVKIYNPRNFRSTPGNLSRLDIEANRAWIRYWTKRGVTVFDIGIDKTTTIRSPFYGIEYRSIYKNWNYQNVIKLEGY